MTVEPPVAEPLMIQPNHRDVNNDIPEEVKTQLKS